MGTLPQWGAYPGSYTECSEHSGEGGRRACWGGSCRSAWSCLKVSQTERIIYSFFYSFFVCFLFLFFCLFFCFFCCCRFVVVVFLFVVVLLLLLVVVVVVVVVVVMFWGVVCLFLFRFLFLRSKCREKQASN